MQLVITAESPTLQLMVEAQAYRDVWHGHARVVRQAYRQVCVFDFTQRLITAHVIESAVSNSGSKGTAMNLAGNYRTREEKLVTLIHELTHRLLNGNGLHPIDLGLIPKEDWAGDPSIESAHRLLYLINIAVVQVALGHEGFLMYEEYEYGKPQAGPYHRAWEWASRLTPAARQRAMERLRDHALEKTMLEPLPWKEWFEKLIA